jgi:hypothetical protein
MQGRSAFGEPETPFQPAARLAGRHRPDDRSDAAELFDSRARAMCRWSRPARQLWSGWQSSMILSQTACVAVPATTYEVTNDWYLFRPPAIAEGWRRPAIWQIRGGCQGLKSRIPNRR